MAVQVALPHRVDRAEIRRLLRLFLDRDRQFRDASFLLDFTDLSWIEPAGIAGLCNLMDFASRHGVSIDFSGLGNPRQAIIYLDDLGFFEQFGVGALRQEAERRSTMLPLQQVSFESSYSFIEFDLLGWLQNTLDASRGHLAGVKTCLQELFNNINDHSRESIGCLFGQHYPTHEFVRICLSDFGIGIPASIGAIKPGLDDGAAIHYACIEGTSSRSRETNMGAGLDHLIRYTTMNNGGRVHILSGYGELSCVPAEADTAEAVRSARVGKDPYPGTLIDLRFETTSFGQDDDDCEDLEW